METQVETPEVNQIIETALMVVPDAKSLSIATIGDYKFGQGLMSKIKSGIKILEETRMGITRPLDESKAKAIALFAGPLQRLNDAKNYLNTIMVNFTEEQEAKRREEERRLQEEARKRAENEALQQALEAEAAGEKEEAEAIIAEPVYVPPIKVMSEVPKSKESHIRETWSCEVIDLMALVQGIVEGKAPLLAVKADLVFLNDQARAYRQTLKIAGCRAISKKTQI